jgi:hypothetical protein
MILDTMGICIVENGLGPTMDWFSRAKVLECQGPRAKVPRVWASYTVILV